MTFTKRENTDAAAAGVPSNDTSSLTTDQLDYMADLIAELRDMAALGNMTTLSTILALAQVEAAREAAARRKA